MKPDTKLHRMAPGYSMALYAVVLAVVGIPLMSLSIDITRLMYARTHLQAAVDAACEAGAQALDVPTFMETGVRQIEYGQALANATREFRATISSTSLMRNGAVLTGTWLVNPTTLSCTGNVHVSPMIGILPEMIAGARSISELRVERR
ncbi:hypothetical protein EG834_17185 [bacterium]|nr:hypothetical protein [bacterium]